MTANRTPPFGVKPDCCDEADLPEHWDKRRVHRYCYYGEGHDGERVGRHPSESKARAAARKAVADGDAKEADIWWESVIARWVPAKWATEDGYRCLVPETNEWDCEYDNAGSICAFTKDESGVVVEGEAS